MPLPTELSGKHVLITGGGKGIGLTISKAFLAEGANVSYCGRSTRGDEFWNFNDAKDGAHVVGTKVDLGNHQKIKDWVESSAKEFGRIDYIVANAATTLRANTPDNWRTSFEADVLGLLTLIEASVPHLEKSSTSSITIISSLAGWEAKAPVLTGPYPVVKRAQGHIGKGFSKTLAPKGIRVNTIVPGPIATPNVLRPDGTEELSTYHEFGKANPEAFEAIQKFPALGRVGKAEEVANAVRFLASPLAGFTTGATLLVDGGSNDSY